MVAKLYLRCLEIMFGLFCMCRTSSSLSCSLELWAPGHAARGNPSGGNFTGAIKLENKGKITCHIPPLFPRTFCPSVILRRFTSAGYVTVQGSRRARGSAGRPLIPLSHWFCSIQYIYHAQLDLTSPTDWVCLLYIYLYIQEALLYIFNLAFQPRFRTKSTPSVQSWALLYGNKMMSRVGKNTPRNAR